jgi:hypothetical protein
MKYLLLLCLFLVGTSLVNASSFRHKKEKWYTEQTSPKHHRNGKKIAANVAGALATGIGKDAMENLKKKRNKDYSPVYPN